MKRIPIAAMGAAGLAAAFFYAAQSPAPRDLAALTPAGALLYLESADFARQLDDWNGSTEKREWLAGADYAGFSRSHLFLRLGEQWSAFADVAGFKTDMPVLRSIAGHHSTLALYDIGDLEFLYITELPEARAMQTALWEAHARYEARSVAGIPFYVRRDGGRVIAFAAARDCLFVATREEMLAGALRLLAGEKAATVRDEAWFAETTRAAGAPGELRLVMNLEGLFATPHFRSHWIQRNTPSLRQYWAGISDLRRESAQFREDRIFLRTAGQAAPAAPPAAAALARLAPADAGFYRAYPVDSPDAAIAALARKLFPPPPSSAGLFDRAPDLPGDSNAGTEADLETRIDEPPLVRDERWNPAPLREILARNGVRAALEVHSTADGTLVGLGSAVAFQGASAWDGAALRAALSASVADLWSTAGLGLGWVEHTRGAAAWHELEGLATLAVAVRGDILIAGNSPSLVAAMLERAAQPAQPATASYVAEFRRAREQRNYERLMTMIEPAGEGPAFFAGNLAGLGRVLRRFGSASIAATDTGSRMSQTVLYRRE